jgi:hypothetical protein
MERRGRYQRAREWRSLGTKEAVSVKKGVRSLEVAGSVAGGRERSEGGGRERSEGGGRERSEGGGR